MLPLLLLIGESGSQGAAARAFLEQSGFRVLHAPDGPAGIDIAERCCPEVAVLDVDRTNGTSLNMLCELTRVSPAPVILLASDEEADAVTALGLGADDYMAKPISLAELTARARAALRRMRMRRRLAVQQFGTLELDRERQEVRADGQPVALTPLEYALLEFLARAPGRTFSQDQLLEALWSNPVGWQTATVSQHVQGVRRKLDAAGVQHLEITTVRSFGYRFDVVDVGGEVESRIA
jgi:two-component system response regulator ResD